MIREYAENIPDDFTVSVPVVKPWVPFPVCEKCGGILGAGIPILRRLMAAWGRCGQSYAFCKGDHNSQVQMPTMNLMTGEMGSTPVKVPCFGIIEPHLHIACGRCQFSWLMSCKK